MPAVAQAAAFMECGGLAAALWCQLPVQLLPMAAPQGLAQRSKAVASYHTSKKERPVFQDALLALECFD
jgi:hypothetical protein